MIAAAIFLHVCAIERNCRNFHCVEPGILYRSGQMSPSGLKQTIDEYGIGTVISLRNRISEHDKDVDAFEEEYCNEHRVRFYRICTHVLATGPTDGPARAGVQEFLDIMHDYHFPKPVLVHCYAGVHRTGAYCAAYRIVQEGWSTDDAVAEMVRMGGSRSRFSGELLSFVKTLNRSRP